MGGEGKSRRRRSSPSSGGEEEERERKKKRDKKEIRRSRRDDRGDEEEEERRSRKRKNHEDRGKDKERDSKDKPSKEKERSKRKHKDDLKQDFKEISKDDYFSKNNEFATWLKEEKANISPIFLRTLLVIYSRSLLSTGTKESCHHNIMRELVAVHGQHTGGTSKHETVLQHNQQPEASCILLLKLMYQGYLPVALNFHRI
ncbi:hypothetical protein GUJ93_ZPchr0040g33517 [Zizania palustris]|uniref:Uncharacterized protein n=1 Tax=Zizania palustris TaxID=103762 RepID=A0A8J5VFT8_ZIZPA|nr:hypothetical protein GUJ93_ZPchr0040g33517 [Zizania palustris]